MLRLLQLAVGALLLTVWASAETFDRIVATVDNRPILQSDWDDAVAFEAVLNGKPLSEVTSEARMITLSKLIDQILLLEQMQSPADAAEAEARHSLADLRESLKLTDDEQWRKYLSSYELSEQDCLRQLVLHLAVLHFADFRLRAGAKVDRSEIEAYYRDKLVPEVKRRGAEPDSLDDLAPKIERLLTEQKISEMLSTWLHNLREQGTVQYLIELPERSHAAQPKREVSRNQ